MKTLLVITKQPGTAAAIRAAASGLPVHIAGTTTAGDEHLLQQADAVLIEEDLTGVRALRAIDAVQAVRPGVPILVLAAERQWQWEEDAYLRGVRHVLSKPIRPALLKEFIHRVLEADIAPAAAPQPAPVLPAAFPAVPAFHPHPPAAADTAPLETIREFSRLLSGGFEAAPLVQSFLQLLRELLRVNRAAVLLVPPPDPVSGQRPRTARQPLHCAASVGIAALQNGPAPLSLESGIGGHLWRHGRALLGGGPECMADAAIAREFDRLGVRLALPVLDGGDMIGVALLDGRLTGEPLQTDEIALLFRLFEGLGAAVRNCWEHERLTTNHRLMSDILAGQAAGCLVVSRNLQLLRWNRRAAELLGLHLEDGFVFRDLPQEIGSRVFESLTAGVTPEPFRHVVVAGASPRHLLVTVSPFQRGAATDVEAVLVVMDDHTQLDRTRELEVESSRLRLIRAMAEGMAHEIGNCLVPLSTHQQLMEHKLDDPEFRASLSSAMTDGVRRISRLSNQMLFLTRDRPTRSETLPVTPLVEEAFREVQMTVGDRKALLVCEGGAGDHVEGNAAALRHALSEIILNALQANPGDPQVQVNLDRVSENGAEFVRIQVSDKGGGFTEEAARRATEPFYTTRNVGLGLGLTVTKRIAETHGGRLEIAEGTKLGRVALLLPLVVQPAKAEPASKQARVANGPTGRGARRVAEIGD